MRAAASVHGGSTYASHASIHASSPVAARHTVHGASHFDVPPPSSSSSTSLMWPLNVLSGVRRRLSPSKSVHGAGNFLSLVAKRGSPTPTRRARSHSAHNGQAFPELFALKEADSQAGPAPASPPPPPLFFIDPASFCVVDVRQSDSQSYARSMPHLALALEAICTCNDDVACDGPRSAFDAAKIPALRLDDYVARILKYTKFSGSTCFCVALLYMRKIFECGSDQHEALTFRNVHRLLVTAVHVACKASDDVHHANSFMALVAGIEVRELQTLELALCELLGWRLMPDADDVELLLSGLRDDPHTLRGLLGRMRHTQCDAG